MDIEKNRSKSRQKRLREIRSKISYAIACYWGGYYPNRKDIDYENLKEIAKRLEGKSEKETLVNVLEWQERNITFWEGRHPMPMVFYWAIVILTAVFTPVLFSISILLTILGYPVSFESMLTIWLSVLTSTLIAIIIVMSTLIKFHRKIPIKKGLINTFKSRISMNFMLNRDNKLGVCRDYARLSACLLANFEKKFEIYFLQSKGHVAAGTKIGDEIYMVDQKLPLLTIRQWFKREHGSTLPSKIGFPNNTVHKLKNGCFETISLKTLLSDTFVTKLSSVEELSIEVEKMLDLPKSLRNPSSSFSSLELLKWKQSADFYQLSDDIVNYSLARKIKNQLANEFIELKQVAEIKIKPDGSDLIFHVIYYPVINRRLVA